MLIYNIDKEIVLAPFVKNVSKAISNEESFNFEEYHDWIRRLMLDKYSLIQLLRMLIDSQNQSASFYRLDGFILFKIANGVMSVADFRFSKRFKVIAIVGYKKSKINPNNFEDFFNNGMHDSSNKILVIRKNAIGGLVLPKFLSAILKLQAESNIDIKIVNDYDEYAERQRFVHDNYNLSGDELIQKYFTEFINFKKQKFEEDITD
jgi:hypothetical protein